MRNDETQSTLQIKLSSLKNLRAEGSLRSLFLHIPSPIFLPQSFSPGRKGGGPRTLTWVPGVCVLVVQPWLTLCIAMDCRPQGSSVHPIFQNIGVGCHSLLQGIFPSQGSNLHCRQILYRRSHQGSLSWYVSTASSLHHYCDVSPSIRLSMLHTGGPNQPFAQLMVETGKSYNGWVHPEPDCGHTALGVGWPWISTVLLSSCGISD